MIKLLIFLLPLLATPLALHANFAEFFGSGALSSALAGQGSFEQNRAETNSFAPALLGFAKKAEFSTSTFYLHSDLLSPSNIVITNQTNGSGTTYGGADVDNSPLIYHSFHLLLPIAEKNSTIGLSLLTSLDKVVAANSGDSILPEYVFYRSRYKRPQIFLNYARQFNDRFSLSLGFLVGFKAGAYLNTRNTISGATYGSSAKLQTEMTPLAGVVASVAYKQDENYLSFTYLQEMKSTFRSRADGVTNDPNIPFDITVDSMIYYDPHILRLSYEKLLTPKTAMISTLEYQIWSGYKPPTLTILKNSGTINSSDNFEKVQTENILLPKIGLTYKALNHLTILSGLSYRKTPLSGDFSGAGNSVDCDKSIVSGGISTYASIFSHRVDLTLGIQYHHLKKREIVKSPNQEDGTTGVKIGAPGYKIGGDLTNLFLGLSTEI